MAQRMWTVAVFLTNRVCWRDRGRQAKAALCLGRVWRRQAVVQRTAGMHVQFVCLLNTVRSPGVVMATHCHHQLPEKGGRGDIAKRIMIVRPFWTLHLLLMSMNQRIHVGIQRIQVRHVARILLREGGGAHQWSNPSRSAQSHDHICPSINCHSDCSWFKTGLGSCVALICHFSWVTFFFLRKSLFIYSVSSSAQGGAMGPRAPGYVPVYTWLKSYQV